jgi:hypothetical protein
MGSDMRVRKEEGMAGARWGRSVDIMKQAEEEHQPQHFPYSLVLSHKCPCPDVGWQSPRISRPDTDKVVALEGEEQLVRQENPFDVRQYDITRATCQILRSGRPTSLVE